MSSYTGNLNLFKVDPLADGNSTFNIETMMNDNWDKIDKAMFKATTSGTATALTVDNLPLADGQKIQIKLHIDISDGATLNGKQILTSSGEQITSGAKAGSFLLLVYNLSADKWFQIGGSSDNKIVAADGTKYIWGIDVTGIYLQEV